MDRKIFPACYQRRGAHAFSPNSKPCQVAVRHAVIGDCFRFRLQEGDMLSRVHRGDQRAEGTGAVAARPKLKPGKPNVFGGRANTVERSATRPWIRSCSSKWHPPRPVTR